MHEQIFISYARNDGQDFAHKLYDKLTELSITVWMDKRGGIPPGKRWRDEIKKAIEHSKVLVFIASPASVISKNCEDEWSYAQSFNKLIIPLKLHPCEMPFGLANIQYIDFSNNNFEPQFRLFYETIYEYIVIQNGQKIVQESELPSPKLSLSAFRHHLRKTYL